MMFSTKLVHYNKTSKTNLFKQYLDRIMIGGKDEWKN